jgi:NAD(P)H-nitrite reductase large subunit
VYRKLVLRRGRLAGALLFGDISGAKILYRLYRDRTQVDEEAVVAAGLCRNVAVLYAAVCHIANRPGTAG